MYVEPRVARRRPDRAHAKRGAVGKTPVLGSRGPSASCRRVRVRGGGTVVKKRFSQKSEVIKRETVCGEMAATRAAALHNLGIAHGAVPRVRSPCALRLYVPNVLLTFVTQLLRYLDVTGHVHYGAYNGATCLLQACQHDTFIQHATLAFTGEWPLYRHLLESCSIVSDMNEADFILAPVILGTLVSMSWTKPPGRGKWTLAWYDLVKETWEHHGARTLIFATIDVPHLHYQVKGNGTAESYANSSRLLPLTWVHQGDTTYTRSHNSIGGGGMHLPESITVPHRTSQWLPFGFPPHPRPPKTLLLYGNINTDKKIRGEMRRKQLASSIEVAVRAFNVSDAVQLDWLSVKAAGCIDEAARAMNKKRCRRGTDPDLKTPRAAALASMRSRFCLCPSGDIPTSFTARLFFSVIHECIPIVLDLWDYVGEASQKLAFPFPHTIDWHRFVIVRSGMNQANDVVRELVSMPEAEVEARLTYMRSIAGWLVYDGMSSGMGAEAAFVRELEARAHARRLVDASAPVPGAKPALRLPAASTIAPATTSSAITSTVPGSRISVSTPDMASRPALLQAGIQIPPAQPSQCTLNLSASALADRAYFRLYGQSYKLHHLRGGDSRWKGVMQPALWRDGDLLVDVGGVRMHDGACNVARARSTCTCTCVRVARVCA